MADLHPDVIAAIRDLSRTSLGKRYNKFTKKTYGISGPIVAGKTVAGEFGSRSTKTGRGVVSSAGARGPAQFIPSTRADFIKKYGIDPWKDDVSAIKGLMEHQLTRGGLKGYNPGDPGYSDYILGQKLPTEERRSLRGGSAPQKAAPQTHTIPGQSFAAERGEARRALLLGGNINSGKLLAYKAQVDALKDVPAVSSTKSSPRVNNESRAVPKSSPKSSGSSRIYEVFYDPIGSYWDAGKLSKGAIGGHSDHVHVSGSRRDVERLGRIAAGMGFRVSGQRKFGGTPSSGHVEGSFHYKDEAIDVSGRTPALRAKFAKMVLREAQNGRTKKG